MVIPVSELVHNCTQSHCMFPPKFALASCPSQLSPSCICIESLDCLSCYRLKTWPVRISRSSLRSFLHAFVFEKLLHDCWRVEYASYRRFRVRVTKFFHILPPFLVPLFDFHQCMVNGIERGLDFLIVVDCLKQSHRCVVDVCVVDMDKAGKKLLLVTRRQLNMSVGVPRQ